MNKSFTDNGWSDYIYWETEDRKTLKRINKLIEDIDRNGNEGVGKPEPLSGKLAGYWSRRINEKDRLVYAIEDDEIIIISCRFHYDDHYRVGGVVSPVLPHRSYVPFGIRRFLI